MPSSLTYIQSAFEASPQCIIRSNTKNLLQNDAGSIHGFGGVGAAIHVDLLQPIGFVRNDFFNVRINPLFAQKLDRPSQFFLGECVPIQTHDETRGTCAGDEFDELDISA